jgi:hypothetical protein
MHAADEHLPLSHESEQHSVDTAHAPFAAVHWLIDAAHE